MMKDIRRGAFFVLEGPNFSGKDWAADHAKKAFLQFGIPCRIMRRPSQTPLGEKIRQGIATWDECVQEAIAMHEEAVEMTKIGVTVFMIRHYFSQLVYQGSTKEITSIDGPNCDKSRNHMRDARLHYEQLHPCFNKSPVDMTFFFSPSVELLNSRHAESKRTDRPIQLPLETQFYLYRMLAYGMNRKVHYKEDHECKDTLTVISHMLREYMRINLEQ